MKDENLEGVSKQDLTNCKLQDFAKEIILWFLIYPYPHHRFEFSIQMSGSQVQNWVFEKISNRINSKDVFYNDK